MKRGTLAQDRMRWLPPKVPLDLPKETRGDILEFLEKVEQSGTLPQRARTTMFFLIPKNGTSDRTVALMPTLICWCEALREPEVAKWQMKYRVDWDAKDGRNGGVQQTVWETLRRKPSSLSASLWSGLGRRISVSQERSCECCRAPEEGTVRRICGGAATDHLARVKVELLAPAYCVAGCTE